MMMSGGRDDSSTLSLSAQRPSLAFYCDEFSLRLIQSIISGDHLFIFPFSLSTGCILCGSKEDRKEANLVLNSLFDQSRRNQCQQWPASLRSHRRLRARRRSLATAVMGLLACFCDLNNQIYLIVSSRSFVRSCFK